MIFRSGNNHPIRDASIAWYFSSQKSQDCDSVGLEWISAVREPYQAVFEPLWAGWTACTHQDWLTSRLGLLSLSAWKWFDEKKNSEDNSHHLSWFYLGLQGWVLSSRELTLIPSLQSKPLNISRLNNNYSQIIGRDTVARSRVGEQSWELILTELNIHTQGPGLGS